MGLYNKKNGTFVFALVAFMGAPLLGNSFTDNGDGTVSDATTSLVWQKCSGTEAQGSIVNDNSHNATCSGTEIGYTWANALNYCKNLTLGGKTWRLPSINELQTLVDMNQAAAPYINQTAFPGTVANFYYWSASTYIRSPERAWGVSNGANGVPFKTSSYYVRCVSN